MPTPLSPIVFDILVALAAEPRHGYAILTDIRERTGDPLRPGSLYRAINRVLEEGLIEEIDAPAPKGRPSRATAPGAHDERRTYYALTAAGRRAAELEARRLEAQVLSAQAAKLLGRRR